MPTEIFEDAIDLHIALLEAEPIAPGPAYPLPRLRPTGDDEVRTFRTIILENPYLRATVIPGLGGRILSLHDKRTDTEILRRHPSLEPRVGGRRGVTIQEGIQLRLDGEDRKNALGNVATQVEEDGVWIAETSLADGLSFHLQLTMPEDRAELRIEARILNRTLEPIRYDGELAIYLGDGELQGRSFYSSERDAGLAIVPEDELFQSWEMDGGTLRVRRFGQIGEIAGRQVDTWAVRLVPVSKLVRLSGANSEAAAYLDDEVVRVQTASERLGHKLFLLTEDGQTLEAPADLYPEHVLEIPLTGLPSKPVALEIRDASRNAVLRIPEEPTPVSEREILLGEAWNIGSRATAFTRLGILSMKGSQYGQADADFERSLLFNAEDPLCWWAKALAGRLLSPLEEEERPELLNAHFLAPLEPMLRAEAFLSQPLAGERDPNPLVAPLAENPEDLIEIACLLLEHGQTELASRWIDEALRHRDLAMLHLLLADSLLSHTRLEAEAAEHVAAANRVAGPPYPWRRIELAAIERLQKRFPNDRLLDGFRSLGHTG